MTDIPSVKANILEVSISEYVFTHNRAKYFVAWKDRGAADVHIAVLLRNFITDIPHLQVMLCYGH